MSFQSKTIKGLLASQVIVVTQFVDMERSVKDFLVLQGSANDIPIAQMCRAVEIDLREMLCETDLPPRLEAINNIVL